jgi:hypothetical protein
VLNLGKRRTHRTNPTDTHLQLTKIKINEGLDFEDRKKEQIHVHKLSYCHKVGFYK